MSKSKDELKVCVYAICKNESKFVQRWLDSMSPADYIVVLDTGSTDETFEVLKHDSRVTRVEQKIYDEFRFDVARNDSMDLAPEDTDILVCTDFDEFFDNPEWCDSLKETWADTIEPVRAAYAYYVSPDAQPYFYDKIHMKGYRWKQPIHEYLDIEDKDDVEEEGRFVQLDDRVKIFHTPDDGKNRDYYRDLIIKRVEESNRTDYFAMAYLYLDYLHSWDFENCIYWADVVIDNMETPKEEDGHNIKYSALFAKARCYELMRDYEKSNLYYLKAIERNPTYREPYLVLAEYYNTFGFNDIAIGLVQECFKKTYKHYDWLDTDSEFWRDKPYDILSTAYFYTDRKEEGKEALFKALEYAPDNERYKYNLQFYD